MTLQQPLPAHPEEFHRVERDERVVMQRVIRVARHHHAGEIPQLLLNLTRRSEKEEDDPRQQSAGDIRQQPLKLRGDRRLGSSSAVKFEIDLRMLRLKRRKFILDRTIQRVIRKFIVIRQSREYQRIPREMRRIRRHSDSLHPPRLQKVPLDQLIDALLKRADTDGVLRQQFRPIRQFAAGRELGADVQEFPVFSYF